MGPLDSYLHDLLLPYGFLGEAMARIVLAACVGGLVGFEREVRGRQAGFRTNMLVCMGSCLVMLVSIAVPIAGIVHVPGITLNSDPARIAYGVMTGIGFLGAGAILQKKDSIRGLTTAAALWCVAALGLACGLGLFTLTAFSALMVLFTLWLLDVVERFIPRRQYRRVIIRASWTPGCTKSAIEWFDTKRVQVLSVSLQREPSTQKVDFSMIVGFVNTKTLQSLERHLQEDSPYELLTIETF